MCVDELRERFAEETGEPVARWDGVFNPDYVYWLEEVAVGAKNTEQLLQPDKEDLMLLVESLTVFSGKDAFSIDLMGYDEVRDETQEFPDHTEFTIGFFKDGKIVRRMWNPSCDIRYKQDV